MNIEVQGVDDLQDNIKFSVKLSEDAKNPPIKRILSKRARVHFRAERRLDSSNNIRVGKM